MAGSVPTGNGADPHMSELRDNTIREITKGVFTKGKCSCRVLLAMMAHPDLIALQ
jgi:hypothetical protein